MQAAERLRGVQIECMPAVDLMRRFNHKKVLVYLDPPYCPGTRHGKQYRHEMYSMESHEELLVAARQHKGPLLISGYESDLYNGMLGGWHKECIGARSQSGAKRTEVLWMNFDPYGRQMDISECLPGAMPSRERRQAW
jgi:DNA adenine methylase